jgi:3'-phosphoadenosine 5'-phosphosulfate sulfotransferase (PAPS reductase)/FAD synthetase
MKHVVMFSGGIGSWAAAKRVAERHGTDDLTLLFTDTLIEDSDLDRFLADAAANVGGEFIRIAEGRTPWEVFRDEKMIANTRVDLCSRMLKRDLADKWIAEHCDPAATTVYLGLDWTEAHRFDNGKRGARRRYLANGWIAEAPLCDPPYLSKADMIAWAKREGLTPSRAYEQGFAHDNCGGFCVKAGIGHFAHLLKVRPDVYREHERHEAEFGGHRTILRDRAGGDTKPLSLKRLRQQLEAGGQVDLFDIGGCGCFSEEGSL